MRERLGEEGQDPILYLPNGFSSQETDVFIRMREFHPGPVELLAVTPGDAAEIKGISIESVRLPLLIALDEMVLDSPQVPDHLRQHQLNVTFLSLMLAKILKFNPEEIYFILAGAPIHDIGKTNILDIVNKVGKLSVNDRSAVKHHPDDGYNFLRNVLHYPENPATIALGHHERFDGSGYPYGLKDKDIPRWMESVEISDQVMGMLEKDGRQYREMPFPPFMVADMLETGVLKMSFSPILKKAMAYILRSQPLSQNCTWQDIANLVGPLGVSGKNFGSAVLPMPFRGYRPPIEQTARQV